LKESTKTYRRRNRKSEGPVPTTFIKSDIKHISVFKPSVLKTFCNLKNIVVFAAYNIFVLILRNTFQKTVRGSLQENYKAKEYFMTE
jgi:hypothetical protein